MKAVIANHQAVGDEPAHEFCLLGWCDADRFLDGLYGTKKMGIGAGAADTRQELGYAGNRFSPDCLGVEAFIVGERKFEILNFSIPDFNLHAGRTLNFGDLFNGKIETALMHSSVVKIKW